MFTPFMSHGTMHQEPLNMPERPIPNIDALKRISDQANAC
jgi:hypothetical protein